MKAAQYIYTMCKNNEGKGVGYRIYSTSENLTEEECNAIKEGLEYRSPYYKTLHSIRAAIDGNWDFDADWADTPKKEEIKKYYPFNFSFFPLSDEKFCIGLTHYLGQYYDVNVDHRYGNYMIHAIVIDRKEMKECPIAFFGEKFFRKDLTPQELEAEKYLPLPELTIEKVGTVVTGDRVREFVKSHLESVAYLFSAYLENEPDKKILYINDSRERMVLWIAALQKMLPFQYAKEMGFATYVYDKNQAEKRAKKFNIRVVGLPGQEGEFDYRIEKNETNQVVYDGIHKIKSEHVTISKEVSQLVELYCENEDEFQEWLTFLSELCVPLSAISLKRAKRLFDFIKKGGGDKRDYEIEELLAFVADCCEEQKQIEFAEALTRYLKEEGQIELRTEITCIRVIATYAPYTMYSLRERIIGRMIQNAGDKEKCDELKNLLDFLKERNPSEYEGIIRELCAENTKEELEFELEECPEEYKEKEYLSLFLPYEQAQEMILWLLAHSIPKIYQKQDSDMFLILLEKIQDKKNILNEYIQYLCGVQDEKFYVWLQSVLRLWVEQADEKGQQERLELVGRYHEWMYRQLLNEKTGKTEEEAEKEKEEVVDEKETTVSRRKKERVKDIFSKWRKKV